MSPKSRRRKGKFSAQRSHAKGVPSRTTPAGPTVPSAVQPAAVARPKKVLAPEAPSPKVLSFAYSNISTELKTIGIMAGALLVVLIVVAIVLT